MRLLDLPPAQRAQRLHTTGLSLRTGPFVFRIRSSMPAIDEGLGLLYRDCALAGDDEFVDFDLQIDRGRGLRRWIRPQARFIFDGQMPFEPLPADHAYPLLEWGMNWCISAHVHQQLLLHSAVIERDGMAVIMPAPPGSGKSTLCAGLIHRGWRLLSDELALISLQDGLVTALARPVSLKNQSMDVIKRFAPEAVFNRISHGTQKGSVTHMRAPTAHVHRVNEQAKPRWVVFPRYAADSEPLMMRRSRADSLLELGRNSFNYMVLGRKGFDTLADMVSQCDCFDFRYSRLDDAVRAFDGLIERANLS